MEFAVKFAHNVLDMQRELKQLREEVVELREYKKKYNNMRL